MPLDNTHQHSSADIMRADDTSTPISPGGGGETPTLAEVLVAGNDPDGAAIAAASTANAGGASLELQPGDEVTGGGGASLVGGGYGAFSAAFVSANGAETNADGAVYLHTKGADGFEGQLLGSDVDTALTFFDLLSSGSGAPGGTFTTLLYLDTTAVTGGLYAWNGSAYTKVGNVVT